MEITIIVTLSIVIALLSWILYSMKFCIITLSDQADSLKSQLGQCQTICDQYKEKAILSEQTLNKYSTRHAAKEWAKHTDPFVRPLNHCNCVPPANLPE